MRQSVPPTPPNQPDEAAQKEGISMSGQLTPFYMLLAALFLLLVSFYVLLSGPVSRQIAALQPTPTITTEPTQTPSPTPSPSPSPQPTLTPTLTPQPRLTYNPARDLLVIKMIDERNGWGMGTHAVWRTADGGFSWADVTPASVNPRTERMVSYFLDAGTAWYLVPVGGSNISETGTLYRTLDGGQTWTSYPVDYGVFSTSMFFTDATHGWVLTAINHFSRLLLYTQNGGASWKIVHQVAAEPGPQSGIIPAEGSVFGPVFTSDGTHGWTVVSGFVPQTSISVYASKDGGKIWMPTSMDMPKDYTQGYTGLPRFFGANTQDGVIPIQGFPLSGEGGPRWFFMKTQDGGATWQAATPLEIPAQNQVRNRLLSVASMLNYFILENNTLYSTADGGET